MTTAHRILIEGWTEEDYRLMSALTDGNTERTTVADNLIRDRYLKGGRIVDMAKDLGISYVHINNRIRALHRYGEIPYTRTPRKLKGRK
jgi:hypothetical protein